ncbi:hypothetical protein [Vibrio tapetis]|uniref:Uncharacterized protein n=1 Tax=Vibrio tapetis subsp. tapetis TaxID=1671868 RepID=A0A2N8ZI29_9VIBR|nr:hypothetical protein [Vibrio tapetis]SON51559.1 protein of unknown function [Vibrio tapetis subsp. tapetis]
MEQSIPPIFVTGAWVLAKARHGGVRQPIARNNVQEILCQKGLNSVYTLIHWIEE